MQSLSSIEWRLWRMRKIGSFTLWILWKVTERLSLFCSLTLEQSWDFAPLLGDCLVPAQSVAISVSKVFAALLGASFQPASQAQRIRVDCVQGARSVRSDRARGWVARLISSPSADWTCHPAWVAPGFLPQRRLFAFKANFMLPVLA